MHGLKRFRLDRRGCRVAGGAFLCLVLAALTGCAVYRQRSSGGRGRLDLDRCRAALDELDTALARLTRNVEAKAPLEDLEDLIIVHPRPEQAPPPEPPEEVSLRDMEKELATWRLQGIIRRNGRLMALLNGRVVSVGGSVKGYRVAEVHPDRVVFADACDNTAALWLYSDLLEEMGRLRTGSGGDSDGER
jgi:hypothetical protein